MNLTGLKELGMRGGMPMQAQLIDGKYRSTMLDGKTPFLFPPAREGYIASLFQGARYQWALNQARTKDVKVRRVLDVGAGCGEFACWAFTKWPGCWIDMIEYDEELQALAKANAPPGAAVLLGGSLDTTVYDVVRIATPDAAAVLPLLFESMATPILIVDITLVALTEEETALREAARKQAAIAAWEAKVAEARGVASEVTKGDGSP